MKRAIRRISFHIATAALVLALLATATAALAKMRLTSKPEDHRKAANDGLVAEIKDAKLYKVSSGFLFGVKLELTNGTDHDSTIEDARMFLNTNSGAEEFAVPMVYDGTLPKLITGKKGAFRFTDATAVTQLSPLTFTSLKKQPVIRVGETLNTDIPLVWKKGANLTRWVWGEYLYEPGSKDILSVELFDFKRTSSMMLKKPRLRVSTFLNRSVKEGPAAARSNPKKAATP